MRDDGDEIHGMGNVTKIGGMRGQKTRVLVALSDDEIVLNIDSSSYGAGLNAAQARYLARKFYRLARLLDQRGGE